VTETTIGRTPVAVATHLTLWRDDDQALHLVGGWPDDIVVSPMLATRLAENPPESHAYITDAGILIVRTVEGSAGYLLSTAGACRRVI
jgi:hypothetical protein